MPIGQRDVFDWRFGTWNLELGTWSLEFIDSQFRACLSGRQGSVTGRQISEL